MIAAPGKGGIHTVTESEMGEYRANQRSRRSAKAGSAAVPKAQVSER